MDVDAHKKQEAVNGLIKIAIAEGALLMIVVAVYLYTGKMTYLIGGVVGTTLIFGPMFLRWFNEHGAALRNSTNGDDRRDT